MEPRDEPPEDCEPIVQAHAAERLSRVPACRARRRARGHRLALAHLRAARLRQHRDPRGRAARPARQGRRDRQGDLRPAPAARRRQRRATPDWGCTSTSPSRSPATCLENAGKLEFPFRRYQIQPAWRGERPQEGRYRQFNQADIDIVGRDELRFHHDVEVMRVMVEALDALPLPAAVLPGQQPQADPGLLPRPRHPRRDRRDPRHRQARQAAGRGRRRRCSSRPPARRRSRPRRCLALATIRVPDTSFVEPCAASASRTSSSRPAWPSWPRSSRAAPTAVDRPGHRRGEPAHRPRARLLHRHGRRDLHGRLRAAEVRRRAAAATTRSPATAGRRTPASASPSASPAPSSRCSPRACSPAAGRRQRGARRARRRGRRARPRSDSPTGCAAAASRPRWRPSPQKFGKQIRYAERRGIPYVWFPPVGDAGTRGQGHPQR